MALPQWTNAGSRVVAPHLDTSPVFVDFRESIQRLNNEHEKAKALKAEQARQDKIRQHEEDLRQQLAEQQHNWQQENAVLNSDLDINKLGIQHGYNLETEDVRFGHDLDKINRNSENQLKIEDKRHGYRVDEIVKNGSISSLLQKDRFDFQGGENEKDRALRRELAMLKAGSGSGSGSKNGLNGQPIDLSRFVVHKKKKVLDGLSPEELKKQKELDLKKSKEYIKSDVEAFKAARDWVRKNRYTEEKYKEDIASNDPKRVSMANIFKSYNRILSEAPDVNTIRKLAEEKYRVDPDKYKPKYKVIDLPEIDRLKTKNNFDSFVVSSGLKSPQLQAIKDYADEILYSSNKARDLSATRTKAVEEGAYKSAALTAKDMLKNKKTGNQILDLLTQKYGAATAKRVLGQLDIPLQTKNN